MNGQHSPALDLPLDYERLYSDVLPSVVSVYVPTPGPGPVRGAGSGFVFDADGEIPVE